MDHQSQPLQPLPSLAAPSMPLLIRQKTLVDKPIEVPPITSTVSSRISIPPLLNVANVRVLEALELPRSTSEPFAVRSGITQDLPPAPTVHLNDTEDLDVQVGSISLNVAAGPSAAAATVVNAKCTCSCLKRRRQSCVIHSNNGENNASSCVAPFKQANNAPTAPQKDLPS